MQLAALPTSSREGKIFLPFPTSHSLTLSLLTSHFSLLTSHLKKKAPLQL